MGFFDKFLGKFKEKEAFIPEIAEENDIPEESDVGIPSDILPEEKKNEPEKASYTAEDVLPEEREEYIRKFRKSFRCHFPEAFDTVESHMQLPYMINSAVDVSPVIELAVEKVYSKLREEPEKLSEVSKAAVAKVAMAIEKYFGETGLEAAFVSCARAHSESLEKAWIVLDFYKRMLKEDYTVNIGKLYDRITDEIIVRYLNSGSIADVEDYDALLAKCARIISEDGTSPEIPMLKKRLFEKLFMFDSIYVVHDDTFNSSFPYVGADGRIEIQTDAKRAESLKTFLEGKGDSKVVIREYSNPDFTKFFSDAVHNGLGIMRLDNGLTPVEIDLAEIYDNGEDNVMEVCNRTVRGMFIRELQYGYRLKKLLSDKQGSEEYRVLAGAMLNARSTGYRALAGGIVYAFNIGGGRSGVTMYTPNALEKAREIMKVMGEIDESVLIAPGDDSYEIFNGELALRSVQKRDAAAETGMVCAFTDIENAAKIRRRFAENGANDAVVAVTLGELCRQCSGCAGFILDMSSYGIEVPKEMFVKISENVKSSGQIIAGKEV